MSTSSTMPQVTEQPGARPGAQNDTGAADVEKLHLENDLLTSEVRELRIRLSRTDAELRRAREGLPPLDPAPAHVPAAAVPMALSAEEQAQRDREAQALADIEWLVRRMNESPVGRGLRKWAGWRTLVERYGA